MALSLEQIVRGAQVRLAFEPDGTPRKHQPLGVIERVKYRNKPDHIWTANGIEHEDGKDGVRQCIYANFGKGEQQVNAAQLVLHRMPTKRTLAALENRVLDEQAAEHELVMAAVEKPIQSDPLRIKEARKTK